jgi:hypothetical protein
MCVDNKMDIILAESLVYMGTKFRPTIQYVVLRVLWCLSAPPELR